MNEIKTSTKMREHELIDHGTISIFDVLLICARRIKTIVMIPSVLCVLIIFYLIFLAKPSFTSSAKIISSSNSSKTSQAAGLAAQFGIDFGNQTETKWVYQEIIKSRTIAKKMLDIKFDTNEFGSQKSLLQIITYGNGEIPKDLDKIRQVGVDNLLKSISVSENFKTGILTVDVNASEPKLASEINKALLNELDSHQKSYNKSKTSEAKKFIEERINDTKAELIAAEEELKVFNDRNRRIGNSPALQLEQQRLTREASVLTGVYTTLKQQLETTKIEEVKESDYVIIIDSPNIPIRRSKPNRKLILLATGILGLILGIIVAFISEFLSNNKPERKKLNKVKILMVTNLSELLNFRKR